MEFQAKVIQFIGETSGTSKAGNPWKKKEWVVETFGQYPKKVKIQCFGERSDSINLVPGQDYNLYVDLESREYQGRWYTDVSVYRVEDYMPQQPVQTGMPQGSGYQPSQASQGFVNAPYGNSGSQFIDNSNFGGVSEGGESDEDLPF